MIVCNRVRESRLPPHHLQTKSPISKEVGLFCLRPSPACVTLTTRRMGCRQPRRYLLSARARCGACLLRRKIMTPAVDQKTDWGVAVLGAAYMGYWLTLTPARPPQISDRALFP